MACGDLYEAEAAGTTDLYYVDVGAYDTPEYGTVYILDADRPALVDTGLGRRYELVLEAMERVGIDPGDLAVIAPTHVHLDHAGGAGYLADACPNADVYVHERGARHLVDPDRLWAGTRQAVGDRIDHYAEPRPVDAWRVVELTDGDTVDLGDHALEVHHAPGHADHQAAFYDPANDGLFVADAAGSYVRADDAVHPTTPPPNFDLDASLETLDRLGGLDPGALYYGHFGDTVADGKLAAAADVLEEWVAAVRAARAETGDDAAAADRLAEAAEVVETWGEAHTRAEVRISATGVLHSLRD